MAKEPVQHESLLLPGYWRITSFGALTENPAAAAGDLLIRADLAELANWEDSPVDWGRVTGRQRRMLVPVGELPRLHLNAVLHDGRLANDLVDRLEFERWMRREINCDRSNITVITRDHKDDQGNYVVPVRAKWASQLSDHDRHGLFVAFGSGEDPYALVIPCVEVFRFFYATSDVLAKYFLKDRFLDPGAYLCNPSKTAISRTDGKAVLWLRKWMLDADARFLARFAFDEYALGQAQAIFLSTAAANEPSHERRIRALPPFQGTEEVTFLGIPLGSEERPRIFVTRLLSCDWKPPFTELKWDRDNDGRSDPNKREERPPTEWKPSLLNHEQN